METVKDIFGDQAEIYYINEETNSSTTFTYNFKGATEVYLPPYLSFGDYDNSCHIERSNNRVFLKKFKEHPDIIELRQGYGSEIIAIKTTCSDQEIIEILCALTEYPAINDEDCSLMEIEMEQEDWESWLLDDFSSKIEKHYKADYIEPDEDKLLELYHQLKEKTNTYFEVQAGGNGYIDLDRLIKAMPETAPDFLNLEFWDI